MDDFIELVYAYIDRILVRRKRSSALPALPLVGEVPRRNAV